MTKTQGRLAGWAAAVVLAAGPSAGRGREPDAGVTPAVQVQPPGARTEIVPAGCTSCSGGLFGGTAGVPSGPGIYGFGKHHAGGGLGCDTCGDAGCGGCGEAGCYPGRQPCAPCCGQSRFGRMFCAFHDCICCPDPCYEPRWVAAANAAYFVDPVRPTTQTRIRYDAGRNLILPDRAEFFWAAPGRGPRRRETGVDYHELSYYLETGTEKFSFFIETVYRSFRAERNPGASGFGDLNLGTKSLLLDCELLQFAFQFRTYIPTASAGRGLGTGHTSLEPSLIMAMKLYPETYLQAQLAQWIPIGGTPNFQGGVLHYHASFNHTLVRPLADTSLIGTLEFNGYSFQSGGFTDPGTGLRVEGNGRTYFSLGPGLRVNVCDRVDFGVGTAFSVTSQHFADQLYRTEFRWRF